MKLKELLEEIGFKSIPKVETWQHAELATDAIRGHGRWVAKMILCSRELTTGTAQFADQHSVRQKLCDDIHNYLHPLTILRTFPFTASSRDDVVSKGEPLSYLEPFVETLAASVLKYRNACATAEKLGNKMLETFEGRKTSDSKILITFFCRGIRRKLADLKIAASTDEQTDLYALSPAEITFQQNQNVIELAPLLTSSVARQTTNKGAKDFAQNVGRYLVKELKVARLTHANIAKLTSRLCQVLENYLDEALFCERGMYSSSCYFCQRARLWDLMLRRDRCALVKLIPTPSCHWMTG